MRSSRTVQAFVAALLCCACSAAERAPSACQTPAASTAVPGAPTSANQAPTAGGGASSRAPGSAAPLAEHRLPAATQAQIDAVVRGAMKRKELPGAVVLVLRGDQVAFRRAFGHRALQPRPEPMTSDTVFDLASLSKPVATATAIMILVQQGRLALDEPVARHLPAFARGDRAKVTVEQLLLHTSGLPPGVHLARYRGRPEAARAHALAAPLSHPPGRRRIYSDVGYIVLGALVERVSGQSLDGFVAQHITRPLGMVDTGYRPSPPRQARAAPTEQREGTWLRGVVHDPTAAVLGGVAGHAGLFSTADDLARFARMMLGRGALAGHRVLEPASVEQLSRLRQVAGAPRTLGWAPVAGGIAHTGFTGTYLWMDLERRLAVIVLSSRLHPDGKGDAKRLRRELVGIVRSAPAPAGGAAGPPVRLGIDELQASGFGPLRGRRVGLVTNHTGLASDGRRTIDLLHAEPTVTLAAIFSPEHGLGGQAEGAVASGRDAATGVVVHSLYGRRKRPSQAQLAGVDVLVFDIQDAGCRFYTYISTLGYLLEAAAQQRIAVVVLDRPNPIDGRTVEGPVLDPGRESFIAYHPIPVRHGMTVGELALLFNAERRIGAQVQVVKMRHWRRLERFDRTGLPWRPTSPNLRSLDAALIYPGIGLLEATNLSVGRGTDQPFEQIGAPWLDHQTLAWALSAAKPPGIRFRTTEFTPRTSTFAGQRCLGVRFELTDRDRFRAVRTGIEIATQLRRLHRAEWKAHRVGLLLGHQQALDALLAGEPPAQIQALWQSDLEAFVQRRQRYLLY